MFRIFISHSWAYSSQYDKIEEFLQQEKIEYYNHSVPKDDPIHTNGTDKDLAAKIEAKVKGLFWQESTPHTVNGSTKRSKWQKNTTNLLLLLNTGVVKELRELLKMQRR